MNIYIIRIMNIGVSLLGISLQDGIRNGRHRKVDFSCYSQNIKEHLINPLREKGKVKVYLTTYPHENIKNLIDTYAPKKYQLLPYKNSNMRETYIKSLYQLSGEKLDFIISTRFDILFTEKIKNLPFKYDKMNTLFNERGYGHLGYTCDNFFAFPFKFIDKFIESIRLNISIDRIGLHKMIYCFSDKFGKEEVNIMDSNPLLWTGENDYYYLPTIIRR